MNKKGFLKKVGFGLIVVLGMVLISAEDVSSQSLKKTIDMVVAINTAATKAQNQIDQVDDSTGQLTNRYRDLERQGESLRVYNEQIEKLVVAQRAKMEKLQKEINDVAMIGRELTPLMFRMLDNLEEFVSLDIPFMMEERNTRIKNLRELMNDSSKEDSEKFRQILDAYLIELDYGKTIDEYKGKVTVDGREFEVDFFMVGRLALVYKSIDGTKIGIWNQEKRAWEPLSQEYLTAVKKGFRMAKKQSAPGLIHLPVQAPKDAK